MGFFDTGVTYTNSVAVDASDGHGSQLRVSVKDARTDWIVPNTGYDVQTFSVSALSKRNKYIEAGVKLTYYRKDSDNLPISGYSNFVAAQKSDLAADLGFGRRPLQRVVERIDPRLLCRRRRDQTLRFESRQSLFRRLRTAQYDGP